MKVFRLKTACVALAGLMMLSSCIGSFGLTNRVLEWNKSMTDNKFVNELLFVAMHIVPVYPIAMFADVLVTNSVEFWTGNKLIADGSTKELKSENGNYLVKSTEKGYTITKEGEDTPMEMTFNENTQTWSITAEGETYELLTINGDGTVNLNMQNGSYMTVNADAQGVLAARQAVMDGDVHYALK